jgi:hypothetical protein
MPSTVYVRQVGLGFVSIPRCASRFLEASLQQAYGVCPDISDGPADAARVAMIRCPYQRMESAYRLHRHQFHVEIGFSDWTIEACQQPEDMRPAEMQRQTTFLRSEPHVLIRWNFPTFGKLFGLELEQIETNHPPLEWSYQARLAFGQAYAADLELWGSHTS